MRLREVHCTRLPPLNAYANNLHYKCPHCDFVAVFGVPITEEEYEELVELRGGHERWIPRTRWEEIPEIKRRLQIWGYW